MGRATFTIGATNGSAGLLDRSASRMLVPDSGSGGDSPSSASGIDTALPSSAGWCAEPDLTQEKQAEPEVIFHDIWSQLPVADRQRFDHCFSFMVLKALGLRPCSAQEVES
jgi:hypothetical protein